MKYSSSPLNADNVVDMPYICLYTSGQAFSLIQVVGFVGTLIYPEGPARKYLNSSSLKDLFPNNIFVVNMKEKISLCFSKRDLQTFSYSE